MPQACCITIQETNPHRKLLTSLQSEYPWTKTASPADIPYHYQLNQMPNSSKTNIITGQQQQSPKISNSSCASRIQDAVQESLGSKLDPGIM
ncbi:hypothetical protein Nepgr_005341 [Nepenthes gracilis]|uniref:Uncharacterized protein n=1 Tax=Nepenthes gracilis TaxID=150966 RepID=A0AAD3S305_NEPGR|nr:hypothetical protein Nepgr_005341 [Nepenthes gracilis]